MIDADGDTLVFDFTRDSSNNPIRPPGMSIVPATGLVRWDPVDGTHDVSIVVTDSQGGSNTQEYQIVVSAAAGNRPPVITSSPSLVATYNTPYRYQVEADDPDGDNLFYSLVSPPPNATITDEGLLEWLPTQQNVYQSLTVRVRDRSTDPPALRATQRFQVFVRSVNQAPSAAEEDRSVMGGLTSARPARDHAVRRRQSREGHD